MPLGRIGDCEQDIGEFVALLCSPEAGYVNGQSIALDGGQANLG
ncbi:MAG: SDR family oxidoreductase [Halieaceae bacterium]